MPNMNTRTVLGWSAWILVSLSAAGCANAPYAEAQQWGQSVRQAVKAQSLNPDVVDKKLPPPSTDGGVMKSAIDRYQSAFEKPPAPVNVMNIGLGGSAGSAGR